MKASKCFNCEKVKLTPYHITVIDEDYDSMTYDLCHHCGSKYMEEIEKVKYEPPDKKDLTVIKTTEDLLNFLSSVSVNKPKGDSNVCKCGWTEIDFDKYGRMGCSECYDHFGEKAEKAIRSYHKAKEHVGKIPKHKLMNDSSSNVDEELKLLKLKYAKALELEEYEKLPDLKKRIDELMQ